MRTNKVYNMGEREKVFFSGDNHGQSIGSLSEAILTNMERYMDYNTVRDDVSRCWRRCIISDNTLCKG